MNGSLRVGRTLTGVLSFDIVRDDMRIIIIVVKKRRIVTGYI
jgi:hypothetical protein